MLLNFTKPKDQRPRCGQSKQQGIKLVNYTFPRNISFRKLSFDDFSSAIVIHQLQRKKLVNGYLD